jgi:oxygen-independent coproporphyrinogen-3 oxidase
MLENNGFVHYEISNFGKEGFFSRHNIGYWKGEPYLGLGPSAHSYNGYSRQWNIRSNAAYIAALKQNKIPCEKEILTPKQKYNEYIMTSLRTMWGIDLNYVKTTLGNEMEQYLLYHSKKYISSGQLIHHADSRHLFLTKHGKLFADSIASNLFIV